MEFPCVGNVCVILWLAHLAVVKTISLDYGAFRDRGGLKLNLLYNSRTMRLSDSLPSYMLKSGARWERDAFMFTTRYNI